LQALGEGKITAEEMPIDDKTNTSLIRYAPGFSILGASTEHPYTIVGLAKFLGNTISVQYAPAVLRWPNTV
jgi:hypothetical protein